MYFEEKGRQNTKMTCDLALKTAKERKINSIVLATNEGDTAKHFYNSGLNIVAVTHVNGFTEPGVQTLTEQTRNDLNQNGIKVYTSTHVLSGAERSISKKFGGAYPVEIIAHSLRMFGQGVKVAVEISTMALDAGLIPYGEDVIAIGGSGRGADTAVILRPEHASNILNTKIREIICKPKNF